MSPVFAHGQLRLYLLSVLAEGPRHGYEVIQDLEQRFHGLYTPSAGTVYPRLTKLEEEGLVERVEEGRKSTYRITDAGRAEVQARADDVEDLRADLDQSVRQLAEGVRARVQHQASDLRAELRDAARAARASAVPVGAPDRRGGVDRAAATELEQAVNALRSDVRRTWRHGRLSAEQVGQITAILTEAADRIRTVVTTRQQGG